MSTKNTHCQSSNKTLPIDTAWFSVFNKNQHPITIFSSYEDCFQCDGEPVEILANSNCTMEISTKYPLRVNYNTDHISEVVVYNFKQYGRYGFNISDQGNFTGIYTLYEPSNPYLPLLAALMVYFLVISVIFTSKLIMKVVKTYLIRTTEIEGDLDRLQEADSVPQLLSITKTSMRIQALDAFRGIAVLLMIFVNNGGGYYTFLNHSPWNGITVADLVLPWFAWAMGFTIVNSVRVHLRVSISRTRLILKQFTRMLLLILFGLMINSQHHSLNKGSTSLLNLRFPGVLQLLAVSFFICSLIETYCANGQRTELRFLPDIWERRYQWVVMILIIILHECIVFLLPVPGCPKGYLGPGGYHFHGKYVNCTGGAAGYIDRLVFGNHVYSKKMNVIYGPTLPHDPEGLMNTLSAVLIVFLGAQAGYIFIRYYQAKIRIFKWILWFVVTGLISGVLCDFSKEGGVIPVNKNLMSLSFVLCTSSFAFLLFSILYYLIDHKKIWNGDPFIYAGANAIFLYIGHYLTMGLFPFAWEVTGTPTHTTVLAMNLWTTFLWAAIAYYLYKKDIIITI